MNLKGETITVPQGPLAPKVFESAFWMAGLRLVQFTCQVVRLIVLARLLRPEDFGLFGIAMLCLTVLDIFSEPGLQAALIQKRESKVEYFETAWTLGLLRGTAAALIIYLSAPFVAGLFHAPAAASLIRCMALIMLLRSATNVWVVSFERELLFSKYFLYQVLGSLLDVSVAIAAAFIWGSAWALLAGLLTGEAVRFLMSYAVCSSRPRIRLDRAAARELWRFGRWILSSNILLFLLTQSDDLLVGTMLGASALGLYQLAFRIASLPQSEVTQIVGRIAFPLYSRLQDEPERMARNYSRVLHATLFLCLPGAALIHTFSHDFTRLFLGEKWMDMLPALQVLIVYGALRAAEGSTGAVFAAKGRPDYRARIQLVQFAILAVVLYPFTDRWGIVGAAMSMAAYTLIVNPLAVLLAVRLTGGSIASLLKAFGFALLLCAGVESLGMLLRSVLPQPASFLSFFFSCGLTSLALAAALFSARNSFQHGWLFSALRYLPSFSSRPSGGD